jgi:hypothetical protein
MRKRPVRWFCYSGGCPGPPLCMRKGPHQAGPPRPHRAGRDLDAFVASGRVEPRSLAG